MPYFVNSPSFGNHVEIDLTVDHSDGAINELIIIEHIPIGWDVSNVDPPNSNAFDPSVGELEWVFVGGDVISRTIKYEYSVPAGESIGSQKPFDGILSYNDPIFVEEQECIISNISQAIIGQTNPYDINNDGIIGNFELLDAIDCWADLNCDLAPCRMQRKFLPA